MIRIEYSDVPKEELDYRYKINESIFLETLKNEVVPHIQKIKGKVGPRCFLSYAWGNQYYEGRVEELAKVLIGSGVIVFFDRWEDKKGKEIPSFALEKIPISDFILVIGTHSYKQKYEIVCTDSESEHVLRAEMRLINGRLMESTEKSNTVIPVLLEGTMKESFPTHLAAFKKVPCDFVKNDYFQELLNLIRDLYNIDYKDGTFNGFIENFKKLPRIGEDKVSEEEVKKFAEKTKEAVSRQDGMLLVTFEKHKEKVASAVISSIHSDLSLYNSLSFSSRTLHPNEKSFMTITNSNQSIKTLSESPDDKKHDERDLKKIYDSFKPDFILKPKTKKEICNIIQWAKRNNYRVQMVEYHHTWNSIYPEDSSDVGKTILISLLALKHVESNTSVNIEPGSTLTDSEFHSIQYWPCIERDKIFCKVGGAVTNEELREFCLKHTDEQGFKWAVPLNVGLVENTFNGMVSSICHGTGSGNKTISNLVQELEFVNAKGELQIISAANKEGAELMKSAIGSCGLLGVITSITFKLERMSYARMNPRKVDVVKAIPPPFGTQLEDLPAELREGLTQESLDKIIKESGEQFAIHCKESHYAEWFWFILQDKCWTNIWQKDKEKNYKKNEDHWKTCEVQLHNNFLTHFKNFMVTFAEHFDKEPRELPNPPFQKDFIKLTNGILMGMMPTGERIIPLPEAIHFKRDIRHIPVRNVEIEIPIPKTKDGKPDWSICQRACWDAINIIYANLALNGTLPVNLRLEMRIMRCSNITLTAQHGNDNACLIEILSTELVPHREWKQLVEKIIAKWISYKDSEDKPINIRIHLAKEWHGLKFGEQDSHSFIKASYANAIGQLQKDLKRIAKIGGYSVDDMQKMFSNQLWDNVLFSKAPMHPVIISSLKFTPVLKALSPRVKEELQSSKASGAQEKQYKLTTLMKEQPRQTKELEKCLQASPDGRGSGVTKDEKKAYEWYQVMAKQKGPISQYYQPSSIKFEGHREPKKDMQRQTGINMSSENNIIIPLSGDSKDYIKRLKLVLGESTVQVNNEAHGFTIPLLWLNQLNNHATNALSTELKNDKIKSKL